MSGSDIKKSGSHCMRWIALLLITILLTLSWFIAPLASAHANLVRSDPPADTVLPSGHTPTQVQLWFSEQPDPNYSQIQVLDVHSQVVSLGNIQVAPANNQSIIEPLKPNLPDGTYTVIWKTVSAVDGHIVKSAFSFVVGAASPGGNALVLANQINSATVPVGDDASNLSVWSVFIRWLNYLAEAMLVGCAGFGLLIWQPSLQRTQKTYTLEPETLSATTQAGWRRIVRLEDVSLLLLIAGWIFDLIFQLSAAAARSPFDLGLYGSPLADFALNSRFGQIWLIRLGLIVLAWLALLFGRRILTRPFVAENQLVTIKSRLDARPQWEISRNSLYWRGWWALLISGLLLLLTTSLNSHAAGQPQNIWLAVGVDWVHLIATAFWIGGIISLGVALPVALSRLVAGSGNRTRLLACLIPKFSTVALICVALLVLSGLYSTLLEVGTFDALVSTLYGQVLLAKVVIFLVVLLLAAVNLLQISPRIINFASNQSNPYDKDKTGSKAAGHWQFKFRQTVALEAVLLLTVLLSVGVLTSLQPSNTSSANVANHELVQAAAGLNFNLKVEPGQVGINTFTLRLTDENKRPISNASLVQLRFIMVEMDMGAAVVEMKTIGSSQPGVYQATSAVAGMVGTWKVQVIVERPGQNEVVVPFQFAIK